MADYASAASAFDQRAASRGFATPSMPTPRGAPCTAVRDGEWVIGPAGELWKCWDNVGDRAQIVGSVFDLAQADSAHTPYGAYDPFSDAECRECIALPVCMGGCAHHALEPGQRANRCGTFRFEHRAQMRAFIEHARTTQPQVLPMAGADG
jgi:uncharacterized protein